MDTANLVLHLLAQMPVQRAQRLVHEHQFRLEYQRPGDGHALLLATGKLAGPASFKAFQADQLQRTPHKLSGLVAGHPAHIQGESEILRNRHVRKQRVVLEHHADSPLAGRQRVHRAA